MPIKQVLTEGRVPVKIWTDEIEQGAIMQLENLAQLKFIHHHIAAMPDVHWGLGSTVGSVIPTFQAIIPASVGVDIGCGMLAARTNLTANRLPDSLRAIRLDIEKAVPVGRGNTQKTWAEIPLNIKDALLPQYEKIVSKHSPAASLHVSKQIGTLGGGNHFIELCLDQNNDVWILLHSGSRGAGNKIGSYFIEKAKQELQRYHILEYLPDRDLAYFSEYTEIFDDYIEAVSWAQKYAALNRQVMLEQIQSVLNRYFPDFHTTLEVVNCHHNYIAKEHHFQKNIYVTRKGAIRARVGDLGIIPGSMGAKSYIVKGKGNADSFTSCSHGAGRKLGRKAAMRKYTVADLIKQTEGIECPKGQAQLDEIPAAYKDIDSVMQNQTDLVDVLYTLKQVLNVKG